MAYAYWKTGKVMDNSVFDLFFRKNPFQGEFTIFAGLEECLKFLEAFHFSESDIEYLKQTMPSVEDDFFVFLSNLSARDVVIYALDEGTVVFPRIPLIRIEGPLIVTQLLETTFLTLVNYASLMATNAARYRIAAGNSKLLELGLRRAQGPDGGLSASKYSYIGGFDGTSNVLAGKLYNIPVKGTHAHAYVTSFTNFSELHTRILHSKNDGKPYDFVQLAIKWRSELGPLFKVVNAEVNDGELAAFISFAMAFPDQFMVLVDTYDIERYPFHLTYNTFIPRQKCLPNTPMHSKYRSGLLNFCAVTLALNDLAFQAIGIRIDSGDIAYLSYVAREYFSKISTKYEIPWFKDLIIMASNDINEETILSLNDQGHKINCFGIGTHLVTCQKQPSLGCVYKLVDLNNVPRMKLSQDVAKVSLPGRKDAYRLFSERGDALIDLLVQTDEEPPSVGSKILCRHAFEESKRAYVTPSKVEKLHKLYWKDGLICRPLPNLEEIRDNVTRSLKSLRSDIKRNHNPTPYKVAVSDNLYSFLHNLWMESAPIGELT
ncbi:nicotinate phosphoribosyltransferase-like isoform X2 [Photinus pyralis]|nr:nicotinate phosphoribosyltransferase-like isoform X2 [Photinus pyralis]XP_031339982.1 nicotinate phosphoribosyltransferase-like isoform X2 [Photinus pyralis]